MKILHTAWAHVLHAWDHWGDTIIVVAGVVALALVVAGIVRFYLAKNKRDLIARLAAIVVMIWTSEGILQTAVTTWSLPIGFVLMSFFVFETLYGVAWAYAVAERKRSGSPGPAGWAMFAIGVSQGCFAAVGAAMVSLGVLRIVLPLLSLGLALITLCQPRDDDSDEIVERRRTRAARRAATWAFPLTIIGVRLGLLAAGEGQTTNEVANRRRADRIATAADTIAIDGAATRGRAKRRADRARRRLRRMMRSATPAIVAEARRLALQAAGSEVLVVPTAGAVDALRVLAERLTPDQVAALTGQVAPLVDQVGPAAITGPPAPPARINGHAPRIDNPLGRTYVTDPTASDPTPTRSPDPDQVAPLVGDPTADEEAGGPDTTARPQDDTVLLTWYREQIEAKFRQAIADPANRVKVTAYWVGDMCRVDRRQAERLIATIAVDLFRDQLATIASAPGDPLDASAVATLCKVARGPAEQIVSRFRGQQPGE